MRRTVPLVLTFVVGMIMIGEFFIPHWAYREMTAELLIWGLILAAAAYLLGLINLIQINLPKVLQRQPDWGYKLIMLLSLVGTLAIGFVDGETRYDPGSSYKWLYDYVFIPLNATMFSLLAFYIASAAFRAFRARNLEAALLLGAAVIVMVGRVPFGENLPIIGEYMPKIVNWIMDVPNTAARRAIFIGSALGAIATALRVILGLERSHLGSD
jgi:hypothetical protein